MTPAAKILTVSDGVAAGTREDRSGEALADALGAAGYDVVERRVVPDGTDPVAAALADATRGFAGLVVTTGGTGFGPRDLTPEGTRRVLDRDAPGLAEAMRQASDARRARLRDAVPRGVRHGRRGAGLQPARLGRRGPRVPRRGPPRRPPRARAAGRRPPALTRPALYHHPAPATRARPVTRGDIRLNPMSSAQLDRGTAEAASKSWPVLVLSGLLSVVAGVLILSIDWTVPDLALFVAILLILRGGFQMLAHPIDGSGRGWNLFAGGAQVAVGVAFVAWPEVSLLTLAIFIGAWVVVTGIFDVSGAIARREQVKLWWLFLLGGIVEIALGLVLLDRPDLSLALAIAVVGIWAVVAGAVQIAVGFELKHLPSRLGPG